MFPETDFETETQQRRAQIAAITGLDAERIHGIRLELGVLRNQGLLIDIEIAGTSMFKRKATWMELGILDADIRRSRITPGQKYLFPEEKVKALDSIESQMRQLLKEHSYRITGFAPYAWMPYTAYTAFLEKWTVLQERLAALRLDFTDNYQYYIDLAASDFAQIAASAWQDLSSRNKGKKLIIAIDGQQYTSQTAFEDAIVDRMLARFPSRQRITEDLHADYTTALVYGEQDVAADELVANRLRQQDTLERAEIDAQKQEKYLQAHILEREAQHQASLQRLEEEARSIQISAMRQAEAEHARQRLQQMTSPFEEVFTTLRNRLAESAREMLESIRKNGFIRGKVAEKGRGLLELYQLMAVHDDYELRDNLIALRAAIGPIGDQRPSDAPERSAAEISAILEQIDGLAQTASHDLLQGPSRFSLVEF